MIVKLLRHQVFIRAVIKGANVLPFNLAESLFSKIIRHALKGGKIKLKTKIKSSPVHILTSVLCRRKLNNHLIKPFKSGFLAFTTILMIIFLFNLLYFVKGSNEKFGMDSLDFLIAGIGFVLQMTYSVLKSFMR